MPTLPYMSKIKKYEAYYRDTCRLKHGCADCRTPTFENYMVYDELWAAAGMTPKGGFLCLSCLSKRLRRPLFIEDFTDMPVNALVFAGYAMALEDVREREREQ